MMNENNAKIDSKKGVTYVLPFDWKEDLCINGDPSLKVRVVEYGIAHEGVTAKVLWVNAGAVQTAYLPLHMLSTHPDWSPGLALADLQ